MKCGIRFRNIVLISLAFVLTAAVNGGSSSAAIGMAYLKGTQSSPRLVFSKSPIDPTNPSDLTSSITAGDHIYGLLILDRPLKEFVAEHSIHHPQLGYSVTRPALSIDIKIDGNPLFSGRHFFVWDIENKSTPWDAVPTDRYFFFDVAPAASNAKTYAYPKMWFGMLSSVGRPGNSARAGAQYYSHQISLLKTGTHKIDFEITGKTVVKGGFTISDGNYAFYNDIANKLDSAGATSASIPPPKMRNPALETSIRTAARNAGNRDTPMRVSITNPACTSSVDRSATFSIVEFLPWSHFAKQMALAISTSRISDRIMPADVMEPPVRMGAAARGSRSSAPV